MHTNLETGVGADVTLNRTLAAERQPRPYRLHSAGATAPSAHTINVTRTPNELTLLRFRKTHLWISEFKPLVMWNAGHKQARCPIWGRGGGVLHSSDNSVEVPDLEIS